MVDKEQEPYWKVINDYLQDVVDGKIELFDLSVTNHIKKIHDGFSVIGFEDTKYTTINFIVGPKRIK